MVTANNNFETLLNEHDVARVTRLSVASIRRWRLVGRGPRFIKVSSAVRYRPEDVRMWLESRPAGGEGVVPRGNGHV
jgi:hypothetical protein